MKIASFTMLRDEESILEPFCDQLNEFFDLSIVVDHLSSDESIKVVRDRVRKSEIFKLVSDGYPQADLANIYMKMAFEVFGVDYIFFLDCDEYLPFADRAEFEAKIEENPGEYFSLNWRNIIPVNLSGDGDFSDGFLTSRSLSKFTKVAISKKFYHAHPDMVITQGYHTVIGIPSSSTAANISPIGLLHIPVPFREKYLWKMASSSSSIRGNEFLTNNRLGVHWVEHDDLNRRKTLSDKDLINIGLLYPEIDLRKKIKLEKLEFTFPYVKSRFKPGKMARVPRRKAGMERSQDFVILDENDSRVFESKCGTLSVASVENLGRNSMHRNSLISEVGAGGVKGVNARAFDPVDIQDKYIAPLFSLPRKLPVTAWHGHIPFLFVLFRNLRPRAYVDLGVHFGASLIAAATAAQAFDVKTELWGVDTWEGDSHAGRYEGDKIYDDLLSFLDRSFSGVHLIRSTFDNARADFDGRPIDLLHIDGLHTYEAVKHDYENWLPAMSDRGVIMFHDTNVRERDFGVWRLWGELRTKFPSLEFMHSHGLGVLFVGQQSLNDAYLRRLVEDESLFDAYRATVSQVAELLPLRSAYLASEPDLSAADSVYPPAEGDVGEIRKQLTDAQWALQHYKNQLQSIRQQYEHSTSWRVTAPLRYVKRWVGK